MNWREFVTPGDTMSPENVTTVPLRPLDHPSLADEVMRLDEERQPRRKRRTGAQIQDSIIITCSLLLILAGAFIFTSGALL